MFSKQTLPLKKELLSSLVYDYLSRNDKVKEFYSFFPDKPGFAEAIKEIKKYNFNRELLVAEINTASAKVKNTSSTSHENAQLLLKGNTYTVTTGHQLCLFTGPLYFIYKIFSVINLCETLKTEFPDNSFVPVYWMASEDHDSEEINHLNVFGKKIVWETTEKGAVGDFSTKGLDIVKGTLENCLGNSENAQKLIQLFDEAYTNHNNLADATRYLVNALFGKYGIVIVDGNNKMLKQSFAKFLASDIFESSAFHTVNNTISKLNGLKYEVQVNPREINCFYMDQGVRARIEKQHENYSIIGTDKVFTKTELTELINKSPEKISPNVVLRPCYQQYILPNITYVGGPGELAYWLEYKEMFNNSGLFFPVLTPRKFITIMEKNVVNKLEKLGFEKENIFGTEQEMIKIYLERNNKTFEIEKYKKSIESLFKEIAGEMEKVDKTLLASAEAEKQKNIHSIDVLGQKATRAIKQKSETEVNQVKSIKSKFFPEGVPQERLENFSSQYAKWGDGFMEAMKKHLNYDLKSSTIEIIFEN